MTISVSKLPLRAAPHRYQEGRWRRRYLLGSKAGWPGMAHLLRSSTHAPNAIRRSALPPVPLAPTSIFRRTSFRLREASTPAQNAPPTAARPAAAREKENPDLLLRSPSHR